MQTAYARCYLIDAAGVHNKFPRIAADVMELLFWCGVSLIEFAINAPPTKYLIIFKHAVLMDNQLSQEDKDWMKDLLEDQERADMDAAFDHNEK